MNTKKIKYPKADGAKKAAEIFEKTRKKKPSDILIKIISEIPEINSPEKSKRERVAIEKES